ncbi:DUF2291 family protein [Streptomyces sp. NPDC056721]|uniref:DUF2291 family protein n=1 Tax=Streptomyces sp. NPDC056721 TaxID=3345923 RepID=UPI0036CA9168
MKAVQPTPQAPALRNRTEWLTLGRGSLIALVVLVAAMVLSTTYRSQSAPAPDQAAKFNPATYGAKTYGPKVVPAIRKKAVNLSILSKAITADSDAAGKRYGHRDGTSPYSYAVTFTGTAAAAQNGLTPVAVPGVTARVSVQTGPAVNGTSLRDAVGFISFGQFTNQVDFADAGTALNNQVKAKVLAHLDVDSLKGKRITVIGAMTPLTGDVFTVTPISIEPAS